VRFELAAQRIRRLHPGSGGQPALDDPANIAVAPFGVYIGELA
jgi:hypothetical protein